MANISKGKAIGHVLGLDGFTRGRHVCFMCRRAFHWTSDCFWFGSLKDLDDGKPIVKICSTQCKNDFESKKGQKFPILVG